MTTLNSKSFFIFLVLLCCNLSIVFSQVGINTSSPRTALEVDGNMQISSSIEIGTIDATTDGDDNTFMIQDTSGSLFSMDVSKPTGSALGYVQEYVITNPDMDWVRDFDTGIDASDYVLITTSANFDIELATSTSTGADDNASLPYTATFVSGGTWHIIADYPMAANLDHSEVGTWTIRTLIYSKDLSKQLGVVTVPMLNSTSGSASTPIIN